MSRKRIRRTLLSVTAELAKRGSPKLAKAAARVLKRITADNGCIGEAEAGKLTTYGKKLGTCGDAAYWMLDGSVYAVKDGCATAAGDIKAFREQIASGKVELQANAGFEFKGANLFIEGSKAFAAKLGRALGATDLCQMTSKDKRYGLICKGNKGIPRTKMPQVPADAFKDFFASLKKDGHATKKVSMPVGKLHATQKEINEDKVLGMAKCMTPEGECGGWKPTKAPIIVSDKNFVVDGHHRWAAALLNDPKNKMTTYKIDAPIEDILEKANSFEGVKQAGL